MLDKIRGYKTITSCVVIALVAVLKFLNIIDEGTAKLIFEVAASLGLYGLYDRVKTEAKK